MPDLDNLAGSWPLFAMTLGFFLLFIAVDVAIGAVRSWQRRRRIRYRLESGWTLDEAWAVESWRR